MATIMSKSIIAFTCFAVAADVQSRGVKTAVWLRQPQRLLRPVKSHSATLLPIEHKTISERSKVQFYTRVQAEI